MTIHSAQPSELTLPQVQLESLLQRERLLAAITQRIRRSLDLPEVLQTAVEEVRQFLKTDRVLLYQFINPDWTGKVVVESVGAAWLPILGLDIQDECFRKDHASLYQDGRVRSTADIHSGELAPCHAELLTNLQVRANLVVPVLQGDLLWGLLIAHHCEDCRSWRDWEVEFLRQIGTVLAIAIQQASWFNQLQNELAERKAIAAALQANRERLRAVVSSAPIALLATNQQGVITLSSGTILHRLGKVSADLVGISIFEAYAHLPDLITDFQQALTGISFTSLVEYEQGIFEVRHSPQHNATGDVTGVISVATDVTEQKHAEAALRQSEVLRQSEAKNRALLNAIPDAIFRIHRDGTYLDFKPSTAESEAKSGELIVGKQIADLLPAAIAQQFQTQLQRTLETNKPQIFDYQLQNGKLQDYEVRLVTNGTDEVLAIVRNISNRKKVERLKNEFVSTVSHELRTPLTSIRGSLGLILGGVSGELPPQAQTLIDIAYKNSERLILLINDILDIEKIESGKMNFTLKPVELMPLIERTIEANRAYADQLGITLKLESSVPAAVVNVDSERLIQVLTNLLSNAAKFSPAGETVVVAVARHEQTLQISVKDNGLGMPEEFHDRIFQKFAQADSSDSRQKGGTGLGLSIAKAIIERLGGQISFETKVNVGTTFYCKLPEWSSQCNIIKPDPPNSPTQSKPQARILICEDDSDIATLLMLMLQQGGFNVDLAYTAEQAKHLLAENSYHAMTLDLALPGQDGISFIRELRSQNCTRSLPIVVVSAKAQQGRMELDETGIAVIDWLDKPIDQSRLIAVCKQAVGQSQNSQPKILHIEDNADIVQVVRLVLKDEAEVHHATNVQQAKQQLEVDSRFDLVILDLSLPDGSGLELLPFINAHSGLPIPVVLFSARELDTDITHQVTAALVKSRTSNQELLNTIRSLVAHQ